MLNCINKVVLAACALSLLAGPLANAANWQAKDFTQLKASNQPVCAIVWDKNVKHNTEAEAFQKAIEAINDQVKGFMHVKVRNDATDAKGWAPELLARAKSSAILVVFSSDMKQVTVLDRSVTKSEVNAAVSNAVAGVVKYETELKKEKEFNKAQKPKPEAPAPVAAAKKDEKVAKGVEDKDKQKEE